MCENNMDDKNVKRKAGRLRKYFKLEDKFITSQGWKRKYANKSWICE